ncbi:dihydrodipicolinate synthase family protein [Pseudohoeflea coraliihabitans]|uniref:Dihydrodipicolinate synthase family protein n=1 Tax=Pseudohoeflea coraliihabitans TaxID=2860393 RepID=A0ABS6WTD0_9HYPH|nr:dihydrodipicolinate synthase family protein [Pseudohoeflea sp. DP4N28-3]MBW3099050.1 dihydrodipicolinate synthase family protein [Pseudohoeflea sp. DP4N28-3]
MEGIVAAVPTPVDAQGVPQRDLFIEHCRWALGNGCNALNILGSTGEANSLRTEDRMRVMGWAAETLDRTRLMVGTGTPSLAETISLTQCAAENGYRVALVLPPYYYKPVTDDGLFRWYAALHDALGAAKIGIYFYNFPQMTGLKLSVSLIERLHLAYPHRFAGIKDSSGDLAYCREIVSRLPGFKVFPSSETSLSEAAQSGFAGCISATVNQSAPLCAELWARRSQPDSALVEAVGAMRTAISSQPLIPSVKYLVGRRTGEESWSNVVPPFVALDDGVKAALDAIDLNPVASAEFAAATSERSNEQA